MNVIDKIEELIEQSEVILKDKNSTHTQLYKAKTKLKRAVHVINGYKEAYPNTKTIEKTEYKLYDVIERISERILIVLNENEK